MNAENEPAMKRNDAVLNNLPGEFYTIVADDKIPGIVNNHWQQKQDKRRRLV